MSETTMDETPGTPDTFLVLINHTDGHVSIMQYVETERAQNGDVRWTRLATAENVEAEFLRSGITDVVSWRFIEPSDLPDSRDYRAAWMDTGTTIEHDMVRARALHRKYLRRDRAPRLAALDIAQMRGQDVEAKKQALRDITQHPGIEAATTIEELRGVQLPEE